MDAERLILSRARAELARAELQRAESSLRELLGSSGEVAARVRIQLARLRDLQGDPAAAAMLLSEAATLLDGLRESCRRRLERRGDPDGGGVAADRDDETMAARAALLELARAWARLGHPERARGAYTDLLREASVNDVRTEAARHIAALAEYRLAELLVDEELPEAYEHWRRAFSSDDEQVSPYAALRMATEVGDELVTGRVERLFHHAMGSSDPRLFAEAALGLALHLREKRQFGKARRYLKAVAEQKTDPDLMCKAINELAALGQAEERARHRERLGRPRAVQARAISESERGFSPSRRVIVVGAGCSGDYLLESLKESPNYHVLGFVDDNVVGCVDDSSGEGASYRVFGGIDELREIIRRHSADEVLLAIPTLPGSRRRVVVQACRNAFTPLLSLPRVHDLDIGWKRQETRWRLMTQLRPVEIEEMIGDLRVEIDSEATSWLQHESVVVIGAGALGAEICRRLADGDAGRIVLIDRRSSALRKITGELADSRAFDRVEGLVGDATDSGWMTEALRDRSPALVINTTGHAPAAPPVQKGPLRNLDGGKSIVRNEVLVAGAVASAVAEASVPRMIHISSRRGGTLSTPFEAVKALSEEVVLWHAARQPGAVQAVVRVGQLLDSRHGRLARLKAQIQMGATVTIPSADARARFLSMARWAELVLHAARFASNGDLLEPDGGDEIEVRDVAEQAIRLRGWHPGEHVLIEESAEERWDDPLSPEPRQAIDADLGIYALIRPPASDERLKEAFKTCAALVGEYKEGDGGGGDLGGNADSWLGAVR